MKVLVEGWLKYPHSYTIVNVHQLICLLKNDTIKSLYFKEADPYHAEWQTRIISLTELGIINDDDANVLSKVMTFKGQDVDVVYRIHAPMDVSIHRNADGQTVPVVLFYTSEFLDIEKAPLVNGSWTDLQNRVKQGYLIPVTPSMWSARAMSIHGLDVQVIPHGICPKQFYPDAKEGIKMRRTLGIQEDTFVILNVGAMTENKGIKRVIKSFYKLSLTRSDVALVLKGTDGMYQSLSYVEAQIKELTQEGTIDKKTWKSLLRQGRFIYTGDTLATEDLRALYNMASVYLSPYMAEGFNIPVLEAMACGLPCIVTQNGATDDLIIKCGKGSTFQVRSVPIKSPAGQHFLAVEDPDIRNQLLQVFDAYPAVKAKALENAIRVHQDYSWTHVTEDLCNFLWGIVQHTRHPSHPFGEEARLRLGHSMT